MGLSVIFAYFGLGSFDNHSFTTLVEDLRDAGQETIAFECPVKTDTHKASCQITCAPQKSPRYTARLVVKRCVNVPGPRGLVL
jgi:hypothetical protein